MSCELHRYHWPRIVASTEEHHVIPRAWQRSYRPDPRELWDSRTVTCCASGHANVHHWIVAMMRTVRLSRSEDPLAARRAVFGRRRLSSEQSVALEALIRFRAAGGSLVTLTDVDQLGRGMRAGER